MKVAIDALGIHYYGGGRSATLNLLKALFARDDEYTYRVFLTQPEAELAIPGKVEQIIIPVTNRMAVRAWAQAVIPFMTRDCDLIHFMKNLGVFGLRQPNVVTMYDMTTLVYPQLLPKFDVLYWKTIQKWTLHQATRVIAISANTARDIKRFYAIPPEKIDIIYPACADHFTPATAQEIARVRQRYGLAEPYILHLGRLDRKKNASQLVRAYHKIRTDSNYLGKLVFVGEEYSKGVDHSLYTTIQELGLVEHVQFTGPAPDADLPIILSGAQVAVMTSLHEGFGIVALEAMSCGVPTVVNRAGAVHEVVGDAGIVLDGNNLEDIAHALILVTQQSAIRTWMHRRGLQQASRFSWEKAADATIQTYQKACNNQQ
jgi:glycosyltransferase involved in cell wall biosynthesis